MWVMRVFLRKCDGFFVGKNRFVYSPQEGVALTAVAVANKARALRSAF